MTDDPETATLYDVLGVSPDATIDEMRQAFLARVNLLRPDRFETAEPEIADRAEQAMHHLWHAWKILGDADARRRYDEDSGIASRRPGHPRERTGPEPTTLPSEPGHGWPMGYGAWQVGVVAAALDAITDWMAPGPTVSRTVVVPDFRALPVGDTFHLAAHEGLKTRIVRLVEHPAPTEGVVVGQEPLPGSEVRRGSTVTLEVWHPSSQR